MFVHRTRGVVAATLGVLGLGLGACDDPTQNTDLRPEGPPEVLAVLVFTDAVDGVVETATYCKPNDPKRPSLVGTPLFTTEQVCPATLSETVPTVDSAYPDGWYIRIMFDELLNPEIETLTEVIDEETGEGTDTYVGSIATTQPVTLQCMGMAGAMVNVDYDGYYSPSGNRITWPLGPSLVIKPNDPTLVATNTECQITIKDNVTDKNGEAVPAGDRGPYKFKIAPIKVLAIDPPDDPEFDDPIDATQIYFDNVYVQFNTFVDIDSLCPDIAGDGYCDDEAVFSFKDTAHPNEGPGYCNSTGVPCGSLADCDATMGDTVCGRGFCSSSTDATPPLGGSGLPCNTVADCSTAAGDQDDTCGTTYAYSLLPYGFSEAEFGLGPINPVEVEKSYTFSFTPGAKLKDRCGRETTIAPTADNMMVVKFKTNKFEYKTASLVTGETATALKKPKLTFTNVVGSGDAYGAPIPATTLDVNNWDLTPLPVGPGGAALTKADIGIIAADASGQLFFRGHYAMNTEYTFTLKAGAVITDFYGVTYTNPMDKVIKWKTQPAIAITTSTANNATVTKATPTSSVGVSFSFNQSMVASSLDATDYTITDSNGAMVTMDATVASGCGTTSTSCTLLVRKAGLAPGTYKFTLKAGATINDAIGNTYTQAADRVITFTVREAPATPSCL